MVTDLTALVEQLHKVNPNIVLTSEQVSGETCPFGLRQSYSLPHSNVTVQVSVLCNALPNGLELSSDIVTSDSKVLGRFQPLFVSERLSLQEKQAVIDEWVRRLCIFLTSYTFTIVSCLEESLSIGGNS
jgi:hypothetical protein